MKALVVYESMYGNTQKVAEALERGLASGMQVQLHEVATAPQVIPADVTLLIVGGPTHAFGMSRASTRKDAAAREASPLVSKGDGIREWLDRVQFAGAPPASAAFDTSIDKRWARAMGSASRSASKKLKQLGCSTAPAESFFVSDTAGPLVDGELSRAEQYGRSLAVPRSASESRTSA